MSAFDLTRYLPYLVNRTGARIASSFSEAIRSHGVTVQMWRVLAALSHVDGQRVSDLAGLTSIDVSTLSRLLDTMQRDGLIVRRRPNTGDARVVAIHLSDRGRAVSEQIVPIARRYETIALAGFTADEERALKAMLARVYGNLDAIEGKPSSDTEAA